MDAEEGEEKYLQCLTEGEWTDTMPNWSPDNEWIAFSSDREQQGGKTETIGPLSRAIWVI
jgi:Tol biopolymer transport system component